MRGAPSQGSAIVADIESRHQDSEHEATSRFASTSSIDSRHSLSTTSASWTALDHSKAEADWSIVFPGRSGRDSTQCNDLLLGIGARVDHGILTKSSAHGNRHSRLNAEADSLQGTTPTSSYIRNQVSYSEDPAFESGTLPPLHDGTGQFGESAISTTSEAFTASEDIPHELYLSVEHEGENFGLDFVLDYEDIASTSASSTSPPPSLLASTEGSVYRFSPSTLGKDPVGHSSAQQSPTPFTEALSDSPDGDSADAEWAWQDQGRALVTATPRQGCPFRSNLPLSHSTRDQHDFNDRSSISLQRYCSPRAADAATRLEDSAYEAELSATPFALSAGLADRTRRPLASSHASEVSGSQVSAGYKRRHQTQYIDDEGSVRSSKSRRSDRFLTARLGVRSSDAVLRTAISRAPASVSRHRSAHNEVRGDSNVPKPTLSRRQKATRLIAKIFDIDDAVLDAVLDDRGPLALTPQEQYEATRQARVVPRQFGTTEDHLANRDLDKSSRHELIDGRFVEEGPEEEGRKDSISIPTTRQPILALVQSNDELCSSDVDAVDGDPIADPGRGVADPTLPETLCHALTHLAGTDALTSSAVLTSTVDALQGVMPYFVPFSWRLLMRVMREWKGPSDSVSGIGSGKGKQQAALVNAQDRAPWSVASLTEGKVASLSYDSLTKPSEKIERWRERSNSIASAKEGNPLVQGRRLPHPALNTSRASTSSWFMAGSSHDNL